MQSLLLFWFTEGTLKTSMENLIPTNARHLKSESPGSLHHDHLIILAHACNDIIFYILMVIYNLIFVDAARPQTSLFNDRKTYI